MAKPVHAQFYAVNGTIILILILSRPSFRYWDPDVDWWGICGGALK